MITLIFNLIKMLTDHSKILTDDKVKDFVAINFMNILNLQEKNKIIINC